MIKFVFVIPPVLHSWSYYEDDRKHSNIQFLLLKRGSLGSIRNHKTAKFSHPSWQNCNRSGTVVTSEAFRGIFEISGGAWLPLTSSRNRNRNRENRKLHQVPNPNPLVFSTKTEKQILKSGKYSNCSEHQNQKNRSFLAQRPKIQTKQWPKP